MMPRRSAPRTIGAEDAVKVNVSAWLEANDRPVAWLARRMTEAGCPTTTQVAWKMLNTDRTVYVDEIVALSQSIEVSVTDLASKEWKP